MNRKHLRYLVVHTDIRQKILDKVLPKYPRITIRQDYHDILVFSLYYERYSYGVLTDLNNAKVPVHVCTDIHEFVGLVSAHSLGTDLSNLWSNP